MLYNQQQLINLKQIIENLPESERKFADKVALKTLLEGSLFYFSKYGMNHQDINWETHGEVIEALESDAKRALIVMPRGTLKSSLCSIDFPAWSLIRSPDLRILIDSEIYTNSSRFLREIVGNMKTNLFTELWGEFEGPVWTEGEIVIKQRKKILKESSITCSGIGAGKTSQHYDLIIADDMNSPKNSNTEDGLQKVIDHYKMYTSLLEPDGRIIVVGTRYHELDLIGNILENECKIE